MGKGSGSCTAPAIGLGLDITITADAKDLSGLSGNKWEKANQAARRIISATVADKKSGAVKPPEKVVYSRSLAEERTALLEKQVRAHAEQIIDAVDDIAAGATSELESMSVKELRALAASLGQKGFRSLRKAELIALLLDPYTDKRQDDEIASLKAAFLKSRSAEFDQDLARAEGWRKDHPEHAASEKEEEAPKARQAKGRKAIQILPMENKLDINADNQLMLDYIYGPFVKNLAAELSDLGLAAKSKMATGTLGEECYFAAHRKTLGLSLRDVEEGRNIATMAHPARPDLLFDVELHIPHSDISRNDLYIRIRDRKNQTFSMIPIQQKSTANYFTAKLSEATSDGDLPVYDPDKIRIALTKLPAGDKYSISSAFRAARVRAAAAGLVLESSPRVSRNPEKEVTFIDNYMRLTRPESHLRLIKCCDLDRALVLEPATPTYKLSKDELKETGVKELRQIAKRLSIPSYDELRKADLIKLLEDRRPGQPAHKVTFDLGEGDSLETEIFIKDEAGKPVRRSGRWQVDKELTGRKPGKLDWIVSDWVNGPRIITCGPGTFP